MARYAKTAHTPGCWYERHIEQRGWSLFTLPYNVHAMSLQVGMKRFHIYQKTAYNNIWCIALCIKHCHPRQLSSKEAIQIGIDSDLDRFLGWQLVRMTMLLYRKLYIRVYCMYSSDIFAIVSCPLGLPYHYWPLHLVAFLLDGTIDGNCDANVVIIFETSVL